MFSFHLCWFDSLKQSLYYYDIRYKKCFDVHIRFGNISTIETPQSNSQKKEEIS